MTRIHKSGHQATINDELTGWVVDDTRNGLVTVAGGRIDQPARAALFAGGAKTVRAFLTAQIDAVTNPAIVRA